MLVQKADITPELVSRLVATQFPQWAGLPVRPVDADGWDNATFRLGEHMSVRLPSAEAMSSGREGAALAAGPGSAAAAADSRAAGRGGAGLRFPVAVVGVPVDRRQTGGGATVADLARFAADLAGFLSALYQDGPGRRPAARRAQLLPRRTAGRLRRRDAGRRWRRCAAVDTGLAAEVWEAALAARWDGPPVWFHGDAQPGNLSGLRAVG